MMTEYEIVTALFGVLTAPERPAPLYPLSRPLYFRELRVHRSDEGFSVEVDKYGFQRYKRSRRYQSINPPPAVDTDAIRASLNALLPDSIFVTGVFDLKTHIEIHIQPH